MAISNSNWSPQVLRSTSASAIAMFTGWLILPSGAAVSLPAPQMSNVLLAIGQPNIPAYLSYINYTGTSESSGPILGTSESINGVPVRDQGPAANFAISVGLNVPTGEKVTWYVSLSGLPRHSNLALIRNGNFASSKGIHLEPAPQVTESGPTYLLWGTTSGPATDYSYLQHGYFTAIANFGSPGNSLFTSTTFAEAYLHGSMEVSMSKSGAEIAVTNPWVGTFPAQLNGTNDTLTNGPAVTLGGPAGSAGSPRALYAPVAPAVESIVFPGLYSLQTGSATQPAIGTWDWLQSGGELDEAATGISPEIQNRETNLSIIAGVFFGVGASTLVAALVEYRYRPRRRQEE